MRDLPDHPHVRTILAYYDGCNRADEAAMRAAFADDVVHYFVDHAPVATAEGLARYWARVGPRTRAHWSVDHALVQGDEAVIEWAMRWTPPGGGEEILRGTEWFRFRDGRIAEVRSYHANHRLADPRNRELWDFPYEARGYTA